MRIWYDEKTHRDPYGKRITYSEWYKTHDSARPYRDRIMKAINQLRYKGLWGDMMAEVYKASLNWEEERLYQFVCDVRKLAGMPVMTRETYDEGRPYFGVLSKNYKYALEEMWLLCWGDW